MPRIPIDPALPPAPTSALVPASTPAPASGLTPVPTPGPCLASASAPAPTQDSEPTKQGSAQPEQNWIITPKTKDEHLAADHVMFMNKYWPNGQDGWAKPSFVKTFPPSTRVVTHLHSITVLCLYFRIDLQSLYEPGGYIHNVVGQKGSLGQTNSGRALDAIKKEKGFERPVYRSILYREQDDRFDNDIYGPSPDEPAETEDSDDLPTLDTIAVAAKTKRPLESPSTPKSSKRQRFKSATPANGLSEADPQDLTRDDTDEKSRHAASRLRPIEDEAKKKLSDPTEWVCDEGINRSVNQILLYHNRDNFAYTDTFWLNAKGGSHGKKRRLDKFPKQSKIVFFPVQTDIHWSLVVIQQENGMCVKAHHHDSMPKSGRTRSIEKALKDVLGNTKLLLVDDFKQSDGYNCGVFVISAIEHIVLGKKIPQDLDLAKEREKWCDRLPPCPLLNSAITSSHKPPTFEPLTPKSPKTQSSVPSDLPADCLAPAPSSDNTLAVIDPILERIQQAKDSIKGKTNALDQMRDRETFRTVFESKMTDNRGLIDAGNFWNDEDERREFLDALESVRKVQERFDSNVFCGDSKTQVDQDIKDLKAQIKDLHQKRVKMIGKQARKAEAEVENLKLALVEAQRAQREDIAEKGEE